jgi:hypothetical protein
VKGKGIVRADPFEARICDHVRGTRPGFLRRLEEQHHAAAYRPVGSQLHGQAAHDRHVAVMSAQMPLAVDLRAPGEARDLGDRQPVQLTPEQHGRTRSATVINRRDSVRAQIREDLVRAMAFEFGNNPRSCLSLFAGKFRSAMKIVAKNGQFRHGGRCQEVGQAYWSPSFMSGS